MKTLYKAAFGAACALSLTAVSASSASAYIACNREGDCWHVKERYTYHPEFGVTIHPDSWKWGRRAHYQWREHEGRGYWLKGVWTEF